ncbi:4Fe-4S dicluster domain-containing protein [Gammaproteobacteria bacterium]
MSEEMNEMVEGRREFFLAALAATASTVVPGALLHASGELKPKGGASAKVRWGMLVDVSKCAAGCTACVDACNAENGLDLMKRPEGASQDLWDQQVPKWIRRVRVKDNLTGRISSLPIMCQHCESPPCVDVCPTNASFRRADGIVMVDRHTCIGCRYCMMACPYKARSLVHQEVEVKRASTPRGKGCVESCNFCVHRLDNGKATTACQDACAREGHHAILFGDINDPESPVSKALQNGPSRQLRADLKLNTGVRYASL